MSDVLRCRKCNTTSWSPYYFRTPDLCKTCFDAMSLDEQAAVAASHPGQPSDAAPDPPLSDRQRGILQRMLRLGKARYVAQEGMVRWGFTMGIINIAVMTGLGMNSLGHYLRVMWLWPVGGLGWGFANWAIYRSGRERLQAERNVDAPNITNR
jgi:hypothetical protein